MFNMLKSALGTTGNKAKQFYYYSYHSNCNKTHDTTQPKTNEHSKGNDKNKLFEDREEFDALPNLSILLTHSGNFCFSHEMAYIGKNFYVNIYIYIYIYIYIFFISSKFRRAYIIHTVSNYKENTTVINKRIERIYRSY